MKPYPAYQDSGIEWLGEIPEGWNTIKLGFIANVVLGKMLTPKDKGGYILKPYLRAKNILWEKVDVEDVQEMWFSNKELEQYKLQMNDLLVSEGGEVGRTGIWKNELEECYIQNSVHKVSFDEHHSPSYFLYQFAYYGKMGHFDAIVDRVSIAHLTREKLVKVRFMVPPLEEQTAIADFLDEKTAQIDRLVAIKQQQIELLKEQRTALINQAVTKGLNPNVAMKDSGIEWLGKIPRHWEITRLKHLVSKIGSGVTPRGGAEVYQDSGIPLLRSQNVHFEGLRLNDVVFISHEIHESMSNSKISKGDVLINITGASIGRCTFVKHEIVEANVNQHVCILRPNSKVESKFLSLILSSKIGQEQVFSSQNGTSREGLNFEQLGNFITSRPPIEEQTAIAAFLDEKTEKIDRLVAIKQKQIELLKEQRTALISAGVTGKIDVQGC